MTKRKTATSPDLAYDLAYSALADLAYERERPTGAPLIARRGRGPLFSNDEKEER